MRTQMRTDLCALIEKEDFTVTYTVDFKEGLVHRQHRNCASFERDPHGRVGNIAYRSSIAVGDFCRYSYGDTKSPRRALVGYTSMIGVHPHNHNCKTCSACALHLHEKVVMPIVESIDPLLPLVGIGRFKLVHLLSTVDVEPAVVLGAIS